jgi:hypothetical protein
MLERANAIRLLSRGVTVIFIDHQPNESDNPLNPTVEATVIVPEHLILEDFDLETLLGAAGSLEEGAPKELALEEPRLDSLLSQGWSLNENSLVASASPLRGGMKTIFRTSPPVVMDTTREISSTTDDGISSILPPSLNEEGAAPFNFGDSDTVSLEMFDSVQADDASSPGENSESLPLNIGAMASLPELSAAPDDTTQSRARISDEETRRQKLLMTQLQRLLQMERKNPKDIKIKSTLAKVLVEMNRLEDAARMYRKIKAMFPKHSAGYFGLIDVFMRKKWYSRASRELDEATQLFGGNPEFAEYANKIRDRLRTIDLERKRELSSNNRSKQIHDELKRAFRK